MAPTAKARAVVKVVASRRSHRWSGKSAVEVWHPPRRRAPSRCTSTSGVFTRNAGQRALSADIKSGLSRTRRVFSFRIRCTSHATSCTEFAM